MGNTILVAIFIMAGKTIFSLLAGTAFVYFKFPLKGPLFVFVLLTLMMPTDILVVALFRLMVDFHWVNTYQALIVPFLASATGVFLFRQHFSNIPSELADAAQIDGAGPLRFLWSILIPISWNVIGALAMIQFVYVWNQYLWPLLVINDNNRSWFNWRLKELSPAPQICKTGHGTCRRCDCFLAATDCLSGAARELFARLYADEREVRGVKHSALSS